MFWADKFVEKIEKRCAQKIAQGRDIIIRDEKTASGRVHVGSLRGAGIHGLISDILTEHNVNNTFIWETNDFDPMDGLPVYLDSNIYRQHMGKPLLSVPSPVEGALNFAEYYGSEFEEVINELGFKPTFIRGSKEYASGKYNGVIREALEKADKIREIYKRVSGSIKPNDWLPLNVICQKCGKVGTTRVTNFDGELVTYTCEPKLVEWAKGCNYTGKQSPFDGHAKLPWKVEWAAKFKIYDVDVEGAGKDHSTKGGARDVSNAICREVFNHIPPFDIPYEFLQVGGKKMSSSKGTGSSAREIADLLPPHILRLLLLNKQPLNVVEFIPDGDTMPILYDLYDKMAGHYFGNKDDDYARLFLLSHLPELRDKMRERFLPRFAQLAYLVQMPHIVLLDEIKAIKGSELNNYDIAEIALREDYANRWLKSCAPDDYKFEIQLFTPIQTKQFNEVQKKALAMVLEYIKSNTKLDGQELHTKLHEIRKALRIEPKDFFSAIYVSILGKESGPKAGWFLSVLERDFLVQRLKEVSE